MIARRLALIVSIVTILARAERPVYAQMMLPGANNGKAVGAPPRESGAGSAGNAPGAPPAPPLRPVTMKPPGEDTIIGHTLSRDGKSGAMTFDKADDEAVHDKGSDAIALTRLILDGDKISKPQETCSVSVAVTTPIVAMPAGRPSGTLRFDIPLEACPFTIDVLDGAVLVSRADPTCDFAAADCRVTPGGLWGPAAVDIPASRVAELVHDRVRLETTMRTNFRALIKKAGKDRAAVKAIARDQAAFSSQREMTCRDYDQESVHGFCSTRITEARALELAAKYGTVEEGPAVKRTIRPKPKPKATQTVAAPTNNPMSPPTVAPPAAAAQ